MSHAPIEPQHHATMNALANGIDEILNGTERPKKMGFALVMFAFDDGGNVDSRINYISNSERKDMIVAMKEFIANCEGRVINTSQQQ